MAFEGIVLAMLYLATIVFCLVAAGFVAVVSYIMYLRRLKYAHIPGPPVKNFFKGHFDEFVNETKRRGLPTAHFEREILQTYGEVALMWLYHIPMLIVASPDLIKEILVTKNYPKSELIYASMNSVYGQRLLGTGLVTNMNKENWKIKRRLIDHAFHRKYLKLLVPQMNSCCEIMINKLAEKADGKTQVHMLNELSNLTLDVICKVGFGVDFNVILSKNAPFKKAVETALQSAQDTFVASPLEMIRRLFSASTQQKDAVEAIKFLRETGKELIQKRQDEIKNGGDDLPLDLLTCILKTCESDNETITMENLIDEFVTFFFAGHDTTASLLSSFLMELSDHPKIEAKLVREMNDVMGVRSEVDFNDLANLKYTGFAIKEILRVYPPANSTTRVTAQEENIGGYSIPKGTSVDVNFYAACHNPEYFQEPFKFYPERWEMNEEEKPSHYTWTPFSIGPRNCIGQMFALIESKVVLTQLLRVFQFSLVDGQTKRMTERIIVRPTDGVICTLTLREDC